MQEQALALLYAADRLDHVTQPNDGLLSQMARGVAVVCDRYYLSSLAYHTHAVSAGWIEDINRLAIDAALPDLTLFLEITPEVALVRLRKRVEQGERYEREAVLRAVHAAYDEVLARESLRHRVVRLDGVRSVDEVSVAVLSAVSGLVGRAL